MRLWLFTANPVAQGFGKCRNIEDVHKYQNIITDWDNWSTWAKRISLDDMFCIMLQGQGKINGLIAYGSIISEPYSDQGWRYGRDKAWYVDILYKSCSIYVPVKLLKERFPNQYWSPQSSGVSVKAKYTDDILELCRLSDKGGLVFE